MADPDALPQRLLAALRARRVASARELGEALGTSQPSISRTTATQGTVVMPPYARREAGHALPAVPHRRTRPATRTRRVDCPARRRPPGHHRISARLAARQTRRRPVSRHAAVPRPPASARLPRLPIGPALRATRPSRRTYRTGPLARRPCLESTRFDRIGTHDRRGLVTLAAWSDAHDGNATTRSQPPRACGD